MRLWLSTYSRIAARATSCIDRDVVSVPIASRYHREFRVSHFSPVRDIARITGYTIGRLIHHGHVVASYRRSRASQPLVYDTATR